MFLNKIVICNFIADYGRFNFPTQFCLGSISNKFKEVSFSEEISFKNNVYDFSFDYNAIDKSVILNILKYLMVKNKIKKNILITLLLKQCLSYY